ncbi:MAG: energy transducer TonB [Proteobacteria bacterium]|nr:energy transducer TonB [Pseudomonadota bacterium]
MLFSIIAHAVIVLGLTFDYAKPAPRLPSLDVILVQSATGKRPEKADFLANANNEGGGSSDKAVRPTDLVSAPVPKPQPGIAPIPVETGTRAPQPPSERELLTQKKSGFAVHTQTQATEQPDTARPNPNALAERKLEMARLANELHSETQVYAKRPKKKYISANTREAADAAYQAGWVARVERIGNLNYPDEARRQQLQNGRTLSLLLTTGIRRDGSLASVDIIQSSGYKLLDEAAIRIVRLAAPFPPLPANMDYDELYITRTWEFRPGAVLKTR